MTDEMRRAAKSLRADMSLPEMLVWTRLKQRQPGKPVFRRQYPIGPYVADFYCSKARLVIEIDGMAHDIGDRPERDIMRDKWLKYKGLEVYRIAARDVLADPEEAVEGIIIVTLNRLKLFMP
ncbi:endonuclease domain-containing protein [Asticcacaulis sp. ZE23SCel15]|uniref:endonuclease domain-containing protein n=1 Tax=Asticcacaulis sp. ZE23SCel15 TaxID=3059027 RepID=UPI00265E50C3|nr:endonuclease domain-containing protein [Asticcacaulis sp. ZE23SCel15]WKL58978.1 endonuclease domain-containing protein [Asticcacaulis sp. ZE23SCel15]